MAQHSPKWPKISPIWSQLLPNKGQHKPQNTPKMAEHEPNMVPTLAQHPRSAQHGQKWGRRSQNCTLLFCKPARQTTESSQIYQNIPGSRLPRFSCQIIHVCKKYSNIRSDKSRYQHHESFTSTFQWVSQTREGIQIRKTPTKHEHTLPKYQR